ncbi:MAG: nucleotidyltransferase family protein [Desulfobacterales bacterium]|jgi:molybdenum cofactor cytidylyltransferase
MMIQEQPTAGIILAAGAATRFGQPKQLLRLKDKYLIERVLDAALNSRLARVVLVLGFAHQKIQKALGKKLRHAKLQIEVNPHYQKGQGHSLQVGLSSVINTFPAVMFLLADQPLVDAATINCLLDKFWSADKDIGVPTFHGKRGNPSIFSQKFYQHIMKIKGDIGARQIINAHPERVLEIEIKNPLLFSDVDTPEDFEKINKLAL